jgi:wyosine [tRNA(Phe)-imidazoG37] synthetase (radical SAM superfamily)
MLEFARTFRGLLATETMLVNRVNDTESALTEIAEFLTQLRPHRAYLTVPTRPPAEGWVQPPDSQTVRKATLALRRYLGSVELLTEFEGASLGFTGDIEDDLLAIAAVHPVRDDAMRTYLRRAGADWTVVGRLLRQQRLLESQFRGHTFYSTAISKPRAH